MQVEPKGLAAAHGWQWFKESWALFLHAPGLWIFLSAGVLLGTLLLSQLPVIGAPLAVLLMTVIIAGFLKGCEAIQQGGKLEPVHILAGFKEHMPALVILGGVNLGAQMLLQAAAESEQPEIVALGLVAMLVMGMATHFAPALVIIENAGVLQALRLSLVACLRNILPLLLYGLVMLAPTLLAMASVVGVVVWLPLMVAGTYAAYCSIFARPAQGS